MGVTTTYYFAGSTRVAVRQGSVVSYLHADHPGSASLTTDANGNPTSQLRYLPYGAPRSGYPTGSVPTDYRFTGQRSEEATLGSLYDYGARFYSPYLNRWIQPDTIVPQAGNPQSLNRYAYTLNNPLKYVDPNGHDAEPPNLMRQALAFFKNLGYEVVGEPWTKSPYANGADMVFTKGAEALAVELKDVSTNVTLSTLGKSTGRILDYGGSISRVVRSAERLAESSNAQIGLESQTILGARDAGTLGNALFTSAEGVSEQTQAQFNGVFGARNGIPNVLKTLPIAGAALKQAASTQMLNAQVGVKMLMEDVKGAVSTLGNSALSAPIMVVPAYLIDPSSQYSPLNPCRQCSRIENN